MICFCAGARQNQLRIRLPSGCGSPVSVHRVQRNVRLAHPGRSLHWFKHKIKTADPVLLHLCSVFTVRTEPSVPPGSVGLNGMQRRVRTFLSSQLPINPAMRMLQPLPTQFSYPSILHLLLHFPATSSLFILQATTQ